MPTLETTIRLERVSPRYAKVPLADEPIRNLESTTGEMILARTTG
jgi:hypothetical protein